MRIPPSLFDILTGFRSAFDQHYHWILYLAAGIAVGMLVACVWRNIRAALEKLTRQFGRTVTFVSCLQTHSEKNKNANTNESYALDYVIKGVEGKSYTLTPIRIVRKIDGKAVQ